VLIAIISSPAIIVSHFITCVCCNNFITCDHCKPFNHLRLFHKPVCLLRSFHCLQLSKAVTSLTIVIVPLWPFYWSYYHFVVILSVVNFCILRQCLIAATSLRTPFADIDSDQALF
jgi:hypothetical protein